MNYKNRTKFIHFWTVYKNELIKEQTIEINSRPSFFLFLFIFFILFFGWIQSLTNDSFLHSFKLISDVLA